MIANNFDPDEIAKFDELAEQWWDPKGELKTLHAINPPRLAFIKQHFDLKGKNVCDVGCGGGILTESLAKAGATACGLDLASDLIAVANDHATKNDLIIEYHVADVSEFSNQHAGQFDAVTCMEMLEHVPDPAAIIKACARLLKPNGLIFLSTLNRTIKSYLFAIVAAEYILRLIPKGTHSHQQFIKPSELVNLAIQANLTIQDIQGLNYHPLSNTATLSKDVAINYLACFQHHC